MDAELQVYDDKIREIDRVEFSILGNEQVKQMSVLGQNSRGIDIPDLYDNMEPKRGGLVDTRLGPTNNYIDCSTCGLNSTYCVGHFGHITLEKAVFNIGYLNYVKKILSVICLKCSKLLIYKNEHDIQEMLKNKSRKARFIEIRNIVKNVTHCQRKNYGCGVPVSKIKLDIKKTTSTIRMISETIQKNVPIEKGGDKDKKKKIRRILTAGDCYNILKNISDIDCQIMGLDPKKSRPESMIHKIFPVPPVQVRPSIKAEFMASSTMEDDLTHKLADIIKANTRLRKIKEKGVEDKSKIQYSLNFKDLLEYHVVTYQNNETLSLQKSEQKGKATTSISARLKGKGGRVRNNLMGKRLLITSSCFNGCSVYH